MHAPVGLDIGALTPEEIAISIAAELIAIRRGAQNLSHKAVKGRAPRAGLDRIKGIVCSPPSFFPPALPAGWERQGSASLPRRHFPRTFNSGDAPPAHRCDRVIVGAGARTFRRSRNSDSSIVVLNPDWEQGQLSSICAGVRSLVGLATDGIVQFPVDHPLSVRRWFAI